VNPAAAAFLLEIAADVAVHQGEEDEARPPLDIVEHPVEMSFRTHHRPEVTKHLDIVELGEACLGDHLEGLAGGVGEEVEMELAQRLSALWKSLFKSLAEPSGRLQEKDSLPFFGFDPQVDEE
jgi:hypothetical protein